MDESVEAKRRLHSGPLSLDEGKKGNNENQEAAKENSQYEEADGSALTADRRGENEAEQHRDNPQ